MLSQFQEGIGPTPLGLDIASVVGQGLEPGEMARRITGMRQPPPELQARVQAEEQTLREWVKETVDSRG
jgi:hypothetical protein